MSAPPVSCRCRCTAVIKKQSLRFMRSVVWYLLTFKGRPYMSCLFFCAPCYFYPDARRFSKYALPPSFLQVLLVDFSVVF
jgi:hypothetical protein